MVDYLHLVRALDGSDVGKDLWPQRISPAQGNTLQVLEGLNVVLRSLRGHAVFDSISPIQEKHGRGLEAAAERIQHAARHIRLGVAGLHGLGAVHIDIEAGIIEGLLYTRVGDAGHAAKLLENLIGHSTVGLDIGAFDLNVDRSRQAEVENLGDNVGGQKIEGHAGKLLRQLLAQAPDIVRRRVMLAVERHGDVGIARPDHAIRAVHEVHGAIGQADIVDNGAHFLARNQLPDCVLHQIA